jgi:hypothetical protein
VLPRCGVNGQVKKQQKQDNLHDPIIQMITTFQYINFASKLQYYKIVLSFCAVFLNHFPLSETFAKFLII